MKAVNFLSCPPTEYSILVIAMDKPICFWFPWFFPYSAQYTKGPRKSGIESLPHVSHFNKREAGMGPADIPGRLNHTIKGKCMNMLLSSESCRPYLWVPCGSRDAAATWQRLSHWWADHQSLQARWALGSGWRKMPFLKSEKEAPRESHRPSFMTLMTNARIHPALLEMSSTEPPPFCSFENVPSLFCFYLARSHICQRHMLCADQGHQLTHDNQVTLAFHMNNEWSLSITTRCCMGHT